MCTSAAANHEATLGRHTTDGNSCKYLLIKELPWMIARADMFDLSGAASLSNEVWPIV